MMPTQKRAVTPASIASRLVSTDSMRYFDSSMQQQQQSRQQLLQRASLPVCSHTERQKVLTGAYLFSPSTLFPRLACYK